MPGSGKTNDANRHGIERDVVAFEGCGLSVFVPIGFEGDLCNFTIVGPFGSDKFSAFRATAVQKRHVKMFGMDLIR